MIEIILETFKRYFITKQRAYPWSFFVSRLIRMAYTMIFSYIVYCLMANRSLTNAFVDVTSTTNYMTYVLVGTIVFTFSVASILSVGRAYMGEVREGTFLSLLLTPASRTAYLLGVYLEQIVRYIPEILIALLFGKLFGVTIVIHNLLDFFISVVVLLMAMFAFGVFMANLMLFLRDTFITQNTVTTIIYLLCGISFPVGFLPYLVRIISYCIPVTLSIDLMRDVLLHHVSIDYGKTIFLIILSFLYYFTGIFLFKISERKHVESFG